jgi:hypothetical protein
MTGAAVSLPDDTSLAAASRPDDTGLGSEDPATVTQADPRGLGLA